MQEYNHPNGYFDFKLLNYKNIGMQELLIFWAIYQRWVWLVQMSAENIYPDNIIDGSLYATLSYDEVQNLLRTHDKRYKRTNSLKFIEKSKLKKYFNRLIEYDLIHREKMTFGKGLKYYYRPNLREEFLLEILPNIHRLEALEREIATHHSNNTTKVILKKEI